MNESASFLYIILMVILVFFGFKKFRNKPEDRRELLKHLVTIEMPSKNLDKIAEKILDLENKIHLAYSNLKIKKISHSKEIFYISPIKSKKQKEEEGLLTTSELIHILTPNKSCFIDVCTGMLKSTCEYPAPYEDIFALETTTIDITVINQVFNIATFIIKPSIEARWCRKEIENVFSYEIRKIETYNEKRQQLEKKIKEMKLLIIQMEKKEKELRDQVVKLNSIEKIVHIKRANQYIISCEKDKATIQETMSDYLDGKKIGVENYFNLLISQINMHESLPFIWSLEFDEREGILIVETKMPNVIHNEPKKYVEQKSGTVIKPLSKNEKNNIIPSIHPAIILRLSYEILRSDYERKVNLLVLNGWVEYYELHSGILKKAYTASLAVKYENIVGLILNKLDPIVAFKQLQGISAGKIIEIVPIRPVLTLDTKDPRFIEAIPVINTIGAQTNLAAMDWQLFEHLIRELFEKKFSNEGVEVKVTRASRDKGVDAVVFDPDPITGGKYIIQAKRYTNTVDVSSVRDLYAVVQKEGASRGILVTTSHFGADAYEFVKNSPITLINGQQLLGLLNEYGYQFRIDIEEAKKYS